MRTKLSYHRPTKNCQLIVSSITNVTDFEKHTSKNPKVAGKATLQLAAQRIRITLELTLLAGVENPQIAERFHKRFPSSLAKLP